jgi:hypothetical protein
LGVTGLAVDYTFAVLDHLGMESAGGDYPPPLNLKMAAIAIRNMLALAQEHLLAWQRAAYQEAGGGNEPNWGSVAIDSGPQDQGTLAFDRWSDVGIGIDDDWIYYGFVPCPSQWERVKLKDGVPLPLKGDRWKKVLPCFARSDDGKTADKDELAQELGYYKRGEIKADHARAELVEKTKTVSTRLKNTLADLSREIRNQVTTLDTTKVFESQGDTYQAAFTSRHLFRDEDNHITFGSTDWP